MKNITLNSIKGDFTGGITAGIIGLPLCLAFGATSGMGPIAGLYGGIILGILAAVFGGTPTQISAPTGPMTVVSALIIAGEIKYFGSLNEAMGAILLTFALAGAFQILLGVLKLGKYINYLPYPVISGFMSGIGVIVISMQFKEFFGADFKYNNAVQNLIHLPRYLMNINYSAFLIAAITLATARLIPRFTKAVPATLVALIVGTSATYIIGLDIKTIANIPSGIPTLQIGSMFKMDISRLSHIILPALTLGGLGMIDSLLTSVIADKITKTKHNSNRELIGQGIGNIGAALFGGIPGAGTTVVTLANTKSGATTRLSGVFQGLILGGILLFGAQYAEQIPYAVLAGILVSIGFDIMDYTVFRELKIIPKSDKIIILTVFVLTVTWSLLYATAIGFLMASLFFMKKMADTIDRSSKDSEVDKISNKLINYFDDADSFRKDVYIKILKGPVFFGFASRLEEDIKKIPDIKALIIDFKDVPYMDQTGLYSVRDAVSDLSNVGIEVYFTELNEECLEMLKGAGVIPPLVQENHVFQSVEDCIIWLHDHIDRKSTISKYQLTIPSAFTPNEDGSNDSWEISGIEQYPDCKVKIFDTNGYVLFSSKGYEEPWDGKVGEQLVPSGKYGYEIQFSEEEKIEGSLVLVR